MVYICRYVTALELASIGDFNIGFLHRKRYVKQIHAEIFFLFFFRIYLF